MLTDPDYRRKFYTQRRVTRIQRSRNKTLSNPDRREAFLMALSLSAKRWHRSLTPQEKAARAAHTSALLKARGHKPPVRGGNGHPPTKPEEVLLKMFPQARWNYGIKTGKWNGSGIPPVYKVDLGFPEHHLAVEADGASHCLLKRQKQDRKKNRFLRGLGWTVLRFTNRKILQRPQEVREAIESIISPSKGTPVTA